MLEWATCAKLFALGDMTARLTASPPTPPLALLAGTSNCPDSQFLFLTHVREATFDAGDVVAGVDELGGMAGRASAEPSPRVRLRDRPVCVRELRRELARGENALS